MDTDIAPSREESKEADNEDKVTLKIYTDGLGQGGMVGTGEVELRCSREVQR